MAQPAWHPEQFAARKPFLERRGRLERDTRAFFHGRGFMEVQTPYAVAAPGEEVHLPAVAAGRLWLHTSPELAMKRLLVAGAGPIFQLARVWRDEPPSDTHAPEFTMLEWYSPTDLPGLMDQTEAFLRAVLPSEVTCRGVTTSLCAFERVSVAEAFARHAGCDVLATAEDAATLARDAGARLRDGETWEDLFFRLLLERVEPHLGRAHPTFLTDWPVQQAALARRGADPRTAERFELYVCSMELANAFAELTDAAEQRARFEADRARRHALNGGPDWELDEDFLAAMAHGMPEAAGIALGFDRLAMIASGADRIGMVQWLPPLPNTLGLGTAG